MSRLASSAQIRAARSLLGWSRAELAEKIGVSLNTVNRMETKAGARNHATRERAQDVFEGYGIAFLDDDGQRGEGVCFAIARRRPETLSNE